MSVHFARIAFVLVAVLAVGATLFRVATYPERRAERHNTAREVCLKSGGEWVKVGRDEICQRTGATKKI
jgi:hypothetical protein